MTWSRTQSVGLARLWSLLLIVVLSVVALTACEDAPDPNCPGPDDPPLMSVADGGPSTCDPPDPDCEGCGGAWGDPHITTLDGAVYDLQAVGEFTAASWEGVEVQTRFAPWGDSRTVSVVTGVAVSTQDHTVSMIVDPATSDIGVRVDGETRDLTVGPVRLGEAFVGIAPGGDYVISWPDGSHVAVAGRGYLSVFVDAAEQPASSGLFGDIDGDTADAYTTRDGTDLGLGISDEDLYGVFAESWRITDEDSAFWYADGTSTETFTDRTFPDAYVTIDDFDAAERDAALAICQDAGVTEGPVLEACVFDLVATSDTSFAQAAVIAQQRTNATALTGSSDLTAGTDLAAGEGTEWMTVLPGRDLSANDLIHASDSSQVYVLTTDSEGTESLTAINAATGSEVWTVDGVEAACGVGVLNDGRLAVVGTADGSLAVKDAASLTVLDPSTGAALASTPWEGQGSLGIYCSPMAVAGDIVAVTNSQGAVKAWDASLESAPSWDLTDLERVGGSLVVVRDSFVVTSQSDDGGRQAVLIDAATGEVRDTHAVAGRDQYSNGITMLVSGDTVVISLVGDVDDPSRLGTITALTVEEGQLVPAWEFGAWDDSAGEDADHTFSRSLGAFSTGDGLVIGHAGNELFAIDASTGALKWRYVPRGFRWTEAAAPVVNGVIWDGAFGGPLLSTVSTEGELVAEEFGDTVFVGGSRGATATVFGPLVGDVVVISTQDNDGNLLIAGLAAQR